MEPYIYQRNALDAFSFFAMFCNDFHIEIMLSNRFYFFVGRTCDELL